MAYPVIQGNVVGSALSVSSFLLDSWTPGADDLLLLFLHLRQTRTATGVTGNGLTWTRIINRQDAQNQIHGEVWWAQGASPSTGQIEVTLDATAGSMLARAVRISGAASGTPAVIASADTGGTDTASPSVGLTTDVAEAVVVGTIGCRSRTLTWGSGITAVGSQQAVGSAGDELRLDTGYRQVASASATTIDATLSSANDWIAMAVQVAPVGAPPPEGQPIHLRRPGLWLPPQLGRGF
jgi:hypothetical protein